MAFSPFSSFRKYQKFWMATVLLLCMVTFVLCTGVGGDLSQRLLDIFRPRGGKVWAKLDGHSIDGAEMDALKKQRDIANEFMQRAAKTVLLRVEKQYKDESDKGDSGKEGQNRKIMLARLQAVQAELKTRLDKPRYFEGSIKFNDVLDFAMWRHIADRLDIDFQPETVQEMLHLEIFAFVPLTARNATPFFGGMDIRMIQRDLQRNFQNVTDAAIYRALRDEFRVRTAQLCLLLSQPTVYMKRSAGDDRNSGLLELFRNFKLKVALGAVDEVRMPLAPEQMWDIFKQKRSPYDIAVVPVPVEKFLDKVPEPTDGDLQVFFEDYKKTAYDPASPTPGFMIPQRVKVEWIMADPESAYYKGLSQAAYLLQITPPVGWSPAYPQLVAAARYGVGSVAFRALLARDYDDAKKGFRRQNYAAAPLTEPSLPALLDHLSKPTPIAVASMVASAGTVDAWIAARASYRAQQYRIHAKELEPLVAAEDEARLKLFAPLAGLAAAPSPFTAPAALAHAEAAERFLPLAAVEAELQKQRETKLAHDWVNANMLIVKERLESPNIQGKAVAINIAVKGNSQRMGFIQKFGLQHAESKAFHDPFNISKAPELAPMRESFDKYRFHVNTAEGRAGKEERLKENDFPRLFFDASEPSFSVAVGKYVPRAWPPVVEIRSADPNAPAKPVSLFDKEEKPFMFWKTADLDSRTPESLKEVREQVVRAWKIKKAREKYALAEARRIAVQLQKSAPHTQGAVAREEAAKLGVSPIYLEKVAELVPAKADFRTTYHDYIPPKNEFEYPRHDLAGQLLALTALEKSDKALQTGYSDLDNLNTELLKTKKVHQIQVLTNKPQNIFYVSVVTGAPGANMAEFAEALRGARSQRGFGPLDRFVEMAQHDAGKEFRKALTAQLQKQLKLEIEPAMEETIKSFDANVN